MLRYLKCNKTIIKSLIKFSSYFIVDKDKESIHTWYDTLTQRWFNIGPTSATSSQY